MYRRATGKTYQIKINYDILEKCPDRAHKRYKELSSHNIDIESMDKFIAYEIVSDEDSFKILDLNGFIFKSEEDIKNEERRYSLFTDKYTQTDYVMVPTFVNKDPKYYLKRELIGTEKLSLLKTLGLYLELDLLSYTACR